MYTSKFYISAEIEFFILCERLPSYRDGEYMIRNRRVIEKFKSLDAAQAALRSIERSGDDDFDTEINGARAAARAAA